MILEWQPALYQQPTRYLMKPSLLYHGWSVTPGADATSRLKRNSSLSGLGASGPFYHDPLTGF